MSARLVGRGWLRRSIEFSLPDGLHTVEYDGSGFGYEQVSVDGVTIREASVWWFVPRFQFTVGGCPGSVEIKVWPWLLLQSLVLRVGNQVVYSEGGDGVDKKSLRQGSDFDELG